MHVTLRFFGATADTAGTRQLGLDLERGSTVDDIIERVITDLPGLSKHKLLRSLNHQYAAGNEIVNDGDEIAIFTAVSGG